MTGTTKWFDVQKGFGFITPDDGSGDLFVHHSAIIAKHFKLLNPGDRVEFSLTDGAKGPRADKVVVIGRAVSVTPSRGRPESTAQRRD